VSCLGNAICGCQMLQNTLQNLATGVRSEKYRGVSAKPRRRAGQRNMLSFAVGTGSVQGLGEPQLSTNGSRTRIVTDRMTATKKPGRGHRA